MPAKPNVIARIYLYPTEQGGKKQNMMPPWFGCPLKIDGVDDSYHDCRILLDAAGQVAPGQTVIAPVAFLAPELFQDKLHVGLKFKLWETRFIGEGEITEVLHHRSI